jgi:predicted nuclease of predicted toxin-antitoxin system
MRFKIDENLPVEAADMLQQAGHDATTVHAENLVGANDQNLSVVCRNENRILISLDLGFADIRGYPPEEFPGIIVIRSKRQDKSTVLNIIENLTRAFEKEAVAGKLWIVE